MRKVLGATLLSALILVTAACAQSEVKKANATEAELDTACEALARVDYDIFNLPVLDVGLRITEVARAINLDHRGTAATQKYCEGR